MFNVESGPENGRFKNGSVFGVRFPEDLLFSGRPIRFPARYKKGVKYIAGGLLPRLF